MSVASHIGLETIGTKYSSTKFPCKVSFLMPWGGGFCSLPPRTNKCTKNVHLQLNYPNFPQRFYIVRIIKMISGNEQWIVAKSVEILKSVRVAFFGLAVVSLEN